MICLENGLFLLRVAKNSQQIPQASSRPFQFLFPLRKLPRLRQPSPP